MSKLASIKTKVIITSNDGGIFENNWTANVKQNEDPNEALLAIIAYLGFVAQRAGIAEKANATLEKAIKEAVK